MKLSIGTAQFGLNYGICNNEGIVKENDVKKIFNFCKLNKIKFIDTAQGYGKSHNVIGSLNLKNFKIITKISEINYTVNSDLEKSLILQINKILKELKVNKVYGLLIHNSKLLKGESGKQIYEILNKIKGKKFLKLGVSVYSKKELNYLLKKFDIDIVNIPLSIANDDFNQKNYLSKLKKAGIEIHVRSIFLQGLLLSDYKNLPLKFRKNKFFLDWFKWLKKNNYNKLDVSLNFIKNIENIDKIIIGIDNFNQLKDIVISYKKNFKFKFKKFNQYKIFKNPSRW